MTETPFLNETPGETARAAKERGVRVFLTGLGINVAVAVSLLVLTTGFETLTTKEAWVLWGVSLGRTVVQSIASYVLRLYKEPKQETAAILT